MCVELCEEHADVTFDRRGTSTNDDGNFFAVQAFGEQRNDCPFLYAQHNPPAIGNKTDPGKS